MIRSLPVPFCTAGLFSFRSIARSASISIAGGGRQIRGVRPGRWRIAVALALGLVGWTGEAWALSPPTFSQARGFYASGFQLTLGISPADTAPTLKVRYTLDGAPPTPTTGQDYAAPIPISTTAVVRAIVYDTANTASVSTSVTSSYVFVNDVIAQPANIPSATDPRFANYPAYPRNTYDVGKSQTRQHDYEMDPEIVNNPAYNVASALLAVPTVSVAVDEALMFGAGGYYDGDAEVPASMEILYPNTPANDQQANCSIQGQSSVRLKRSMRLSFSSSFGPSKLTSTLLQTAPVNGASAKTSFDTLVLRAGNNRSWARVWNPDATTYTEDQWYRDSQTAINGVGSHGTFVHLYVNGLYWGLYNIAERPDESFAANYLGGKKGDHFSLKEDGRLKGDATRWNYLVGTVLPKDMTMPANYTEMKDYLDVGLFSDYLALVWYAAVNDWPNNNWWVENRNDQPTPARYFAWDGEWSWDRGNPFDPSIKGETPNGAWVHPAFRNGATDTSFIAQFWRALKVNSDFMMTFADRIHQHTGPGGALSDINSRLRFNALNLYVEDAVVAESARWGDAMTPSAPRTRDVDWNREVTKLYGLMGGNGSKLIAALRAQGYYPSLNPLMFSLTPGFVAQGAALALNNPNAGGAIYYKTDGSDPRLSGGALDPAATLYAGPLTVSAVLTIKARVLNGSAWSALAAGTFTPTTTNHAPVVSAVGPIIATMPAAIALNATASDDGLPSGALTLAWSVASGPGSVTFSAPTALDTNATFAAAGNYVLRFTASDGDLQTSRDVPVFVYPAPVGAAVAVTSFTLFNADTGIAIAGYETLTSGAVLDYATLPTRHLAIAANTSPTTVGSVRFALNSTTNFRTESGAPYSLTGDNNGTYNPWTPALGSYTLKGTPFTGANATGAAGTALTVTFQVADSTPPDTTPPGAPANLSADTISTTSFVLRWSAATDNVGVTGYEVFQDGVSLGTGATTNKPVTGLTANTTYAMTVRARDAAGNWSGASDALNVTTAPGSSGPVLVSFTLINADTDVAVPGFEAIPDGAVLDYATLPTRRLNIAANTSPATVGSVRFALNANANYKTESGAPYAIAGDSNGNYNAWTPAAGSYTLTGTPYTGANAGGTAGSALTVHFQVVDGTPPADTSPPTVPTGLSADTITTTSFTLRWSAATDNVGVTGYEVFRDGLSAGTATATNKSLTGLTAGTTYAMTVRARDAAGNWSAQSTALDVTTASAPVGPAMASFTLINADTDLPVPGYETIPDGAVISRASLPTTRLNIRANPATSVGSVVIKLDTRTQTESEAPYALFGDTAGNFTAGTIADGAHTLSGRAFTGAKATGTGGATLTITFTIQ